MRKILSILLLVYALGVFAEASPKPPYPPSPVIRDITFDRSTLKILAPGSDNWPLTWAEDGNQYTSWGDGGGFGGTNSTGRVSLGFGRVEGNKDNYTGYNVWGGYKSENKAEFGGKCEGIIAIGQTLYMWRNGNASNESAHKFSRLYVSKNNAASWRETGIEFRESFFSPTFCQFGRGYRGARDGFVYIYAPEQHDGKWEIQKPGRITLMRVRKEKIADRASYEFFTGLNAKKIPEWNKDIAQRKPVFVDTANGVHRMSVSYNAGLGRYLLTTMTVSRDGWMGIYDAPNPWGPWTTVYFKQDHDLWGTKVICGNFPNKWLSSDGKKFVIVYTRNDSWGSVEGRFITK